MIYEIRHKLSYRYSLPVYLEAHEAHLLPRTDAFQRVLSFNLKIDPEPSCVTHASDTLGNPAQFIWFAGRSSRVTFEMSARVQTLCDNPFNYLIHENSVCLPMVYSHPVELYLQPYVKRNGEERKVSDFAFDIAKKCGYETVGFLSELCREINKNFQYARREGGFPLPPSETLALRKGSCRDLTALFIACCRSQGIAARFTSGYAFSKNLVMERELHAWAEVYLEGGGWRGYDPATGLAVSLYHIAAASAPEAKYVTPVTGSFRSIGAVSELETQVEIFPALQEAAVL